MNSSDPYYNTTDIPGLIPDSSNPEAGPNLDIKYIKGILRRRKWVFISLFIPVFITAGLIAFLLAPIYKSESLILIESQIIPDDFVKTTVTGYIEERLNMITQRIMSRTKLTEIINRFNLYKDLKGKYTPEEIAQKMKGDIHLQTISAKQQSRSRDEDATIAFRLSYEGKEPATVQKVSNALATLYLEENLKSREQRVSITLSFLQEEADSLKKQIMDYEEKISLFKQDHLGELPGQADVNFQTVNQLKDQLDNINMQFAVLDDKIFLMKSQAAEMEKTIVGKGESLQDLKVSLLNLQSKYSDTHPDVIHLKKLIKRVEEGEDFETIKEEEENPYLKLQEEVKNPDQESKEDQYDKYIVNGENVRVREAPSLNSRVLFKLDKGEEVAVTSYKDDWYNIVLKDERTGWSHKSLFRENIAGEKKEEIKVPLFSEDPAYMNLMNQIELTELQRRGMIEEKTQIKSKIEEYQKRIENSPVTEMEYLNLMDGYSQAKDKYSDILSKLMEARISKGMESSNRGEKFAIIDPAPLPEKPFKPNRKAILVIGFFLAFGAGAGLSALLEVTDTSIKTKDQLSRLTGLSVMSAIPELTTKEELRTRRMRKLIFFAIVIVILIAGVIIVHYFIMPLEIVMAKVQQRFIKMGY